MDTATWVIVGAVVLIVVMLLASVSGRSQLVARPAMKPLAPEAVNRYGSAWERIEAHFVDAPDEAVREADALVLALLGEREHPLSEEKLPRDLQRARRAAAGKEGRGTEGKRIAMLRYRAVIREMGSPQVSDHEREQERVTRREIAS